MSSPKLDVAFRTQKVLEAGHIPSVVSGVWGLNYHGVDIVLHDVELCVPAMLIDAAARVLRGHPDQFLALPDCVEPDLYHCYRHGAKRFQLMATELHPGYELLLVPDRMLGMTVSSSITESGLKGHEAHLELDEYCDDVQADALSGITWPSLAAFLGGWLRLAAENDGAEIEIIYLMYAERLIDANVIKPEWFDQAIKDAKAAEKGKKLLAGKSARLMESECSWHWDWS